MVRRREEVEGHALGEARVLRVGLHVEYDALGKRKKGRQSINHSTDSDFNFPEILKTLILKIVFMLEIRHLEVKTLLTFHWLNYSSPRYSQTILRNIFLENQRNISLK